MLGGSMMQAQLVKDKASQGVGTRSQRPSNFSMRDIPELWELGRDDYDPDRGETLPFYPTEYLLIRLCSSPVLFQIKAHSLSPESDKSCQQRGCVHPPRILAARYQ